MLQHFTASSPRALRGQGSRRTPSTIVTPPCCTKRLLFSWNRRLLWKSDSRKHTSAASRQGGRATSADASHVSQHALLCLGQSRRHNFLLSQAAGFLIPNPKWVVSSTPDIFQTQFESQPSPGGCSSSGWVTVGLVFSREARAGLQQRGATLEGFSPSVE